MRFGAAWHDQYKAIIFQIAQQWLELAERAEKRESSKDRDQSDDKTAVNRRALIVLGTARAYAEPLSLWPRLEPRLS